MADVLFMTTADERTLGRWSGSQNFEISAVHARTGTYAFHTTNVYNWLVRHIAPTATTPYVRVCFLQTAGQGTTLAFREGGTAHLRLYLNWTSGLIQVLGGAGTVLASYQANLANNIWYCVEVQGTIHNTTGTCRVHLNGVEVLNLTGLDTRAGGTGLCDNVVSYGGYDHYMYIDDVMFRDDTWPGQGGIYLAAVTAEANDGMQEWIPEPIESTTDVCVQGIPASFTNYIWRLNNAVGEQHDFEHAGIADLNYNGITAVGVIALAKLSAAGTGQVQVLLHDNAAEDPEVMLGPAVALDTSGMYVEGYWTVDCEGHAFTRTAINAAHIGVEIASF